MELQESFRGINWSVHNITLDLGTNAIAINGTNIFGGVSDMLKKSCNYETKMIYYVRTFKHINKKALCRKNF